MLLGSATRHFANAPPLDRKEKAVVDRSHSLLLLSTSSLDPFLLPHSHRSFQRGLQRKSLTLIKKLRSAKRTAAANNEKPDAIRTHLRNTVIVPEMTGSVIGVYNGKTFNQVEVKPDMVGHYLGEFSISYKPVKHGKAGIGSTTSSRFIPLK